MFQFEQGRLLLARDRDSADVITGREHFLKGYADRQSLTAAAIVDLIKSVLHADAVNLPLL
jgi:hypothetical protein